MKRLPRPWPTAPGYDYCWIIHAIGIYRKGFTFEDYVKDVFAFVAVVYYQKGGKAMNSSLNIDQTSGRGIESLPEAKEIQNKELREKVYAAWAIPLQGDGYRKIEEMPQAGSDRGIM